MAKMLRCLACLALVLAACGDDSTPPMDAAFDAFRPPRDMGPLPTDGAVDAGDSAITPGLCRSDDGYDLGTERGRPFRPRRVAIASGSDGFLTSWSANDGVFDRMYVQPIPLREAAGDVIQVSADEDFSNKFAPALAWDGSGFVLAWFDNAFDVEPRGFQVVTRTLDPGGRPSGTSNVITTGAEIRHDNPALARGPAGVLVGFIEDDILGGNRVVQTGRLGADASLASGPSDTSASPVPALAMTTRTDQGGAVVYARLGTDTGNHVFYRPLDADGAPAGAPEQVDNSGNFSDTMDAAEAPGFIGVVFDVDIGGGGSRREVHFRQVDSETGAAVSLEQILTGTDTGRDPGIAPFAGGFAVAFRALSGEGVVEPTIQLMLVNIRGEVVDAVALDTTTDSGGPVSIDVAFDGTILVAWAEQDAEGTNLKARRIRCD